jgi:hypothetical protein
MQEQKLAVFPIVAPHETQTLRHNISHAGEAPSQADRYASANQRCARAARHYG